VRQRLSQEWKKKTEQPNKANIPQQRNNITYQSFFKCYFWFCDIIYHKMVKPILHLLLQEIVLSGRITTVTKKRLTTTYKGNTIPKR
jgi:hypothetical protein